MTKKIGIFFILGLVFSSMLIMHSFLNKKGSDHFTIAILQTASHPALDAARQGFLTHVLHELKNKISFIVQNAEGQASLAHSIAKQFGRDSSIDAIFAIATPAIQALSHVEKKRPIVIAAVNNPASLSLDVPGTNVCGSSDANDVIAQIEAIKKVLPQIKKFAVLHSIGEINAVDSAEQILKELDRNGLQGIKVGITNESDIIPATLSACRQADALIVPTDNVLASAIRTVTNVALKHGKPVVGSDSLLIDQGVFLVAGSADYKRSGEHAGKNVVRILLRREQPEKLGFVSVTDQRILINVDCAKSLGITLPNDNSLVLVKDRT